jgi:DNA repair exonuclease SbcCD nuclease subunit
MVGRGLFRFIHVSDTHLGYRPQGFLERERDFYDAFRWVVDKALELRVDAVLHAGDLFHSSAPRPATYIHAIRELGRLAEAGVAFVVAPGNHELPRAEGLGSPVKVLESLGLARPVGDYGRPWPVELEGATVIVFSEWASDYLGRVDPASLAKSKVRVGLAHVTLCDALAEAEGVPLERCRGPRRMLSSEVKGGYGYLALGDIHTPWEHRVPGAPPMAYPGSTEYLDVGEYRRSPGGRHVYLVELDDSGGLARLERLRVETVRPWIVLEGGYQEVARAVESVRRPPPGAKAPVVHVTVRGPLDQARRRSLKARLDALRAEGAILYYSFHVEDGRAGPVHATTRTAPPQTVSLESALEKVFEACGGDTRRELVALLSGFISSPDREAAGRLARVLEERGDLVECLNRVAGR